MTSRKGPSRFVTQFVVGSRYMPVYIALLVLWGVASIWAPDTLRPAALGAIAPFATFLAITALGQMLVIMTGGIDLSVPGTLTLGAIVTVGLGDQLDERIGVAVLAALGWGALIGLANGILIGGLKLNALIVTLAMGQVVLGAANKYSQSIATQTPVPTGLTEWLSVRWLGVTRYFWIGVAITIVLVLAFRYTAVGRRFQAVGANPVASRISGLRVTLNQIAAYVVAGVLYAGTGVLLGAFLLTPNTQIGQPYLLGPIAAVVIGGASLTGGLASPVSTWAAAFFLAALRQMLLVMDQSTDIQFVIYGLVIIGGMLVSGDRIIKGVEQVFRERRRGRPAKKSLAETG